MKIFISVIANLTNLPVLHSGATSGAKPTKYLGFLVKSLTTTALKGIL